MVVSRSLVFRPFLTKVSYGKMIAGVFIVFTILFSKYVIAIMKIIKARRY